MTNPEWVDTIRNDFPALKIRRNGRPPVYFDSACTTMVPRQVIDAVNEYYLNFPACSGARSRHWFAEEVTDRLEGNTEKGIKGSRRLIQEFINARSEKEIIFTQNTSHAVNIVALGFNFYPGDVVLLTDIEHNSNLVPWLRLQKKGLVKVKQVNLNPDDTFNLDDFREKLTKNNVKLVSFAYTSNVTGYTIPAAQIIKSAHARGAKVLLDAAQTIPHQAIDVQKLDVDFLAFSLHKMCGPRGVGILYGRQELLGLNQNRDSALEDIIEPVIIGGGTVLDSTYDSYSLLESPERFEVGTQDYPGQIASAAAIEYLQKIGMNKIREQVTTLNEFLTTELLNRYGETGWFKILGPAEAKNRAGILTFEVKRPNAVGIAEELSDRQNIMIRDGVFCVHSYFNYKYGEGWIRPRLPSEHRMTYRVSLYFYNTIEECRIFLDALHDIFSERSYI
ncbi:MAG TPA: aminotransferase class V-fold PLP-dependent enzyme [Dehalococcoidales bacterium]|nr:aminotransferase class V-fold PLP-dependent enzyme [Dehalococcoidales bacterium]